MAETSARQWRQAAMALRDHAAKFEQLAEAAEAVNPSVAVIVTPEAEALMRREGRVFTIDADENGLHFSSEPDGSEP